MSMKSRIAAVITLVALSAPCLAAEQMSDGMTPMQPETSTSLPVTALKFFPTGVKTEAGELQAAPAYGDLAHGRHGTFIRMPAGFVSPLHTHTEDYYAVVISGVGVNTQPGKAEIPLPVGSYWFQKGGEPHVTKCISAVDCIFFLSQPGAFDYLPSN